MSTPTPEEFADYWGEGSATFDDTSTDRRYGNTMVGAGEWFALIDPDTGTLHGVAWTDHRRNLGVFGAIDTDPQAHATVVLGLRACATEGVPLDDAWAVLVERYAPDEIFDGRLEDLYTELMA